MNSTKYQALAALSSALLILLVIHASHNGSFNQPSTFAGIAVGLGLGAIAWTVGKRVTRNREN